MKLIAVSLISCLALLGVVYVISDIGSENRGTFHRQFLQQPFLDSVDISYPLGSHKIVGHTRDAVYLWNKRDPFKVVAIEDSRRSPRQYEIELDADSIAFFNINVRVDSPYFFLADGTVPYIYRGNLADWYGKRFMYDSTFFLDIEPVGNSSFVLRSMSREFERSVLMKQNNQAPFVQVNPNVLEKQIDGYFCTEGMMDYNKHINKVIYVYFYRNQYLVMDTSLNLLTKNSTIDTISRAQIKTVSMIRNGNTAHRLSAPPRVVNESFATFSDFLFLHSTSPAANESIEDFERNYVVDVYNLTDNQYQFSFRINNDEGNIEDFDVIDGVLFVVRAQGLCRYMLNPDYFLMHE